MRDKEAIIDFLKRNKAGLGKRFGVRNIGIFGSFARGEERKTSDIDILVEFGEGCETFKNYMGLKFFLEDELGMRVDLVIRETLKPAVREGVLREAVYA